MSGGAPDIEIEEETEAENNQNSNQDPSVPLTSWPTRPPVVPRRSEASSSQSTAPTRPRVADIHASYGLHVPTPRSLDHIRVQTAPHSAPLNIIGDFARRAAPAMPAMPTPTPTTTSTTSTTSSASTPAPSSTPLTESTKTSTSTASTNPSETFTRVVNALNTPPQPASQSEHIPAQAFTTDDVEDYFIAQMFENLPTPEPEADSETRTGRSRERSEIRLPRSSSREYDFDLQDAGTYVTQHPTQAKEQAEDIVQHATRALDSPVGQAALLATATWNTSKTVLTAGWRLGSWAVKGMTRYISRAPQVEVLPPEAKLPASVRFSNANSSTASSSAVLNFSDKLIRAESYSRNPADALRLRTILSFREAGIIDENEYLTPLAIENSDNALGSLKDENGEFVSQSIKNPKVIETLTQDGSNIADWQKRHTSSIQMPNGQSRRIHFYMNTQTGKIDYRLDYKVKDIIKK